MVSTSDDFDYFLSVTTFREFFTLFEKIRNQEAIPILFLAMLHAAATTVPVCLTRTVSVNDCKLDETLYMNPWRAHFKFKKFFWSKFQRNFL